MKTFLIAGALLSSMLAGCSSSSTTVSQSHEEEQKEWVVLVLNLAGTEGDQGWFAVDQGDPLLVAEAFREAGLILEVVEVHGNHGRLKITDQSRIDISYIEVTSSGKCTIVGKEGGSDLTLAKMVGKKIKEKMLR